MTTTVICVLVVCAGACLQASVGVGLGILAAPILALLWPGAVPGPLLTCAFVLSALVVLRDRRDVDLKGSAIALVGRVPGTVVAVVLLSVLAGSAWLEVLFGGLLLVCVLLAALKGQVDVEPKRLTVAAAGFLSGVSGTAVGVGGPPVALVWSSLPPKRMRSTLGGYFLVGTGLSAILLVAAGRFGDFVALGWLLPATVLGFLLSGGVKDRIDPVSSYRAVLLLSAVSSFVLLLRGVRALEF